ncbi:MAG: alpha/beta hydrolase [Polaromonas sp.]
MTRPDPAWLEAMYNNRARVPEHAMHFSQWAEASAKVRASQRCTLDIAYGPTAGQKLDVFPASVTGGRGAQVVVFIHGGYWRSLDKSEHTFVVPPFTQASACVVVPNYDLCPVVTIPEIVMQMVRSLAWVFRNIGQYGGDPGRITVLGHSAGGHLAAMLLDCAWKSFAADLPANLVKSALSISGLYDLESMRNTPSLQASLKLTPAQVRKASPALLPRPARGMLYSVAGGDESDEFLRHNLMIQQAWGRKTVPVCEALPGLNHFSILEALVQPGHRLNALGIQLLAEA